MIIPRYPNPEEVFDEVESQPISKTHPNWGTDDAVFADLCEELFPAPVKGRLIPEDED